MRTFFLIALLAAPAFAQGSIFPDKASKKVARQFKPEVLSDDMRAFLNVRMKNHNKDMKDLSVAVVMVKMGDVQRLSQDIANEPRLDRAVGLATKLPPRFFELQDQLRKSAQELADAGKEEDAVLILEKYQEVVGHCVSCHATFLDQVKKK